MEIKHCEMACQPDNNPIGPETRRQPVASLFKLYDVVFPDAELSGGESPLYLRLSPNCLAERSGETLSLRSADAQEAAVSFDTYVNAFSNRRWRQYTSLTSLYLRVQLEGAGIVQIFTLDAAGRETILQETPFTCAGKEELLLPIPDSAAILVAFRIISRACVIHRAGFATPVPASFSPSPAISIVICTFKREAYVAETLRAIADARARQPELRAAVRVRLVDNDGAIDERVCDPEFVTLYRNPNTGGAGGFARGMLETLEDAQFKSTHILLMDDDIRLPPGALYKTYALLALLKPEYRNAVVGGAMLDMDDKTRLTASHESYDGKAVRKRRFPHGLDLSRPENVAQHEAPYVNKAIYQAWWYCVFSIATIKEKGLPLPLFFQIDDIEYAVRVSGDVVQINGIFVWHEAFHKKHAASKLYFGSRNFLILGAAHPQLVYKVFVRMLARVFIATILSDYQELRAIRFSIGDFLNGPEQLFQAASCGDALKRASVLNEPEHDFSGRKVAALNKNSLNWFNKTVLIITLNGHFLPNQFLKNSEQVIMPPLTGRLPDIYLQRTLYIGQESPNVGYIRKQNLKELLLCLSGLLHSLFRLAIKWRRVSRRYREAAQYMASASFWKKYLMLEHGGRGRA